MFNTQGLNPVESNNSAVSKQSAAIAEKRVLLKLPVPLNGEGEVKNSGVMDKIALQMEPKASYVGE